MTAMGVAAAGDTLVGPLKDPHHFGKIVISVFRLPFDKPLTEDFHARNLSEIS